MPDARGACRAYDWGFDSIFPRSPRTPSTACGRSPSLEEGGLGLRRSRPTALPSIAYRGFAVAPMTLRAPSRRVIITSEINGRAMRAPTVCVGATDGCKCISQLQFPSPKTSLFEGGGPPQRWKELLLHLPRMPTFFEPPPLFGGFFPFRHTCAGRPGCGYPPPPRCLRDSGHSRSSRRFAGTCRRSHRGGSAFRR